MKIVPPCPNWLNHFFKLVYSADADGDGNPDGDIDCPLLGGRACRSNLKDISTRDFKALSDGIWKYKYKKCTDNCEIIFLKFIQWP